ncbi:MAG: hypothetical protein J7L23_01075 [Candidatus Diapherotrites archaeon]|nr:hypothetical protein [Candidatus Diapherotrites archaeon]
MEKPKRTYDYIAEKSVAHSLTGRYPHIYKEHINSFLERRGIMDKFGEHSVTLLEVGVGVPYRGETPRGLGVKHVLEKFHRKIKEAFIMEPNLDAFRDARESLKDLKGFKLVHFGEGYRKPIYEESKAGAPTLNLIQANLFSSLPSRKADITICSRVMEHFYDKKYRHSFLFNLLLATKPGGYLILSDTALSRETDRKLFEEHLRPGGLKLVHPDEFPTNNEINEKSNILVLRKPAGKKGLKFDREIYDLIDKLGKGRPEEP